jgi:hypothetical protein
LIEHFTLVEEDLAILDNKTGSGRLGCALLLKYFQHYRCICCKFASSM